MKDNLKMALSWVGLAALAGLMGSGFWILHSSASNDALNTPWQAIDAAYVYVFLAITLLTGLMIAFSTLPKPALVAVLAVYCWLMFSYLPLSHPLLYGADGWRHLAEINRLESGGQWREVATGGGGFLAGIGRLSYSGFWFLIAIISKISSAEAMSVLRWLQPVLAAAFFPLLVFWLGRSIGLGRRLSLLTAWLSTWPFALQAMGSFTLPVNLWFLIFLGAVVLLMREYGRPAPRRGIVLLVWLALAFGYSLYPLLYLILWVTAELVRLYKDKKILPQQLALNVAALGLVIPFLERVQSGSRFISLSGLPAQIKQWLGNLTGAYLAAGPRPHDIATGNIFFNQTPSYALVTNLLTSWRWWLVLLMVLFLLLSAAGVYRLLKYGDGAPQILALYSVVIFISYTVGRYFIEGGQIITRRLDAVAALLAVFLFIATIEWLIEWAEKSDRSILPGVVALIVVGSLAITASYTLGPDAKTISFKDYETMVKVAAAEPEATHYCVLADTYPLLALEALTGKRIVGGGFPINANFSQPEREAALNNIRERGIDSYVDVDYALATTGADFCVYILPNGFVQRVGGR